MMIPQKVSGVQLIQKKKISAEKLEEILNYTRSDATRKVLIQLPNLTLTELESYHLAMYTKGDVSDLWCKKYKNGKEAERDNHTAISKSINSKAKGTNHSKKNFIAGVNALLKRAKEMSKEFKEELHLILDDKNIDMKDQDETDTEPQNDEDSDNSKQLSGCHPNNVIKACIETALGPIATLIKTISQRVDKISRQNNKIESKITENAANVALILDKMEPVRGGKIQHYFQMDIKQIYEEFTGKIIQLNNSVNNWAEKFDKMRRSKERYRAKLNRSKRQNRKYAEVLGVTRLYRALKPEVKRMQQSIRDKRVEFTFRQLGFSETYTDYLKRKYEEKFKKDALFRSWAIDIAFPDVVKKINANIRATELSTDEAFIWVLVKVCAKTSRRLNGFYHKQIWDVEYDDDGDEQRQRATTSDGVLKSIGVSDYMLSKALTKFEEDYPELKHELFENKVYYCNMILLFICYFSIWGNAREFDDNFAFNEEVLRNRFQDRINELREGERLTLDFGTFNGFAWIDSMPLSNVNFGSGTNWILGVPDVFSYAQASILTNIHFAFGTFPDKDSYVNKFNSFNEPNMAAVQTRG
eukprot:221014_1